MPSPFRYLPDLQTGSERELRHPFSFSDLDITDVFAAGGELHIIRPDSRRSIGMRLGEDLPSGYESGHLAEHYATRMCDLDSEN